MGGARTAVVTGGSRGIGRAVVLRLASDGVDVLFTYRADQAAAAEVVAAAGGLPGAVRPMRADAADLAAVRSVFEHATHEWDGLDVLVNNAGVAKQATFADATEEQYDRIMGTNAKGTFFAMQQAARRMRDNGRIINISSVNTTLAFPGNALYSASKAAVEQYTAIAAKELGGRGITVNTVCPGATDTDLLRSVNPPETLPTMAAMSPLGRLGTAADIAAVVGFLAGPDGGWITGQTIRASGGLG